LQHIQCIQTPSGLVERRKIARMASSPATQLDIVRVPNWDKYSWLVHGFSTRTGGRTTIYRSGGCDLNLGFNDSDDRETVAANRRLFVRSVTGGRGFSGTVTLRQIHSSLVLKVSGEDVQESAAPAALKGDGLMTVEPGVLLGIQTADCIPILVADTKNRVVAAFHAGWRGTVARIVESGVGSMRLEFGSSPEDLIAAIGPGIGPCCYSVGEEVREQFESQFPYAAQLFHEAYNADPVREKYPMLFLNARAPGHGDLGPAIHLDLPEANRRQLLAAGLKESAIFVGGLCTGCSPDRFFSHRMERGFTGRMMSVIGIASGEATQPPR
jgi:polyphenol oxidase